MRGEFVDIGGTRLYYYAAGTRGAGVPVVLLHGFPTSSRLWHSVARDFPAGHRLVICDLLGFGRSDPPPASVVTVDAHAASILRLLDDLRIPVAAIVGHGLGGAIAQAIAVHAPDRVSHLGLIDSAALGLAPHRLARIARALGPLARRLPPGLLAGLVHGSVRHGFANPERSRLTIDTCLQPFLTPAGRNALAAHLAALAHNQGAGLAGRLRLIRAPTAIIWGRDDPFYPVSHAERLRDAIPGATLDVIQGAAHFTPEDTPDATIGALARLLERREP